MSRAPLLLLAVALLAPACGTLGAPAPSSPPVLLDADEIAGRLDRGEGPIRLGGDETHGAVVARMVEPLPGHLHRVRSEVVVVLGGTGTITIGGETRTLEKGMVMYIPPGVYHAVEPGEGGVDVAVVRIPPTSDESDTIHVAR